MGWLRRSKAYGFYARHIRRRVFGPTVRVPPAVRDRWAAATSPPDLEVDWRDEMYLHFHRPFRCGRALESYLETGRATLDVLDRLLGATGRQLGSVGSLLEFACGWGRNTRFLVTRVDPSRLWVCDIDAQAVRHNERRFGTRGLVSAPSPEDWRCPRRFELVFVASLFSHLPYERWSPWLSRLGEVLEPGGLLLITTHGLDWLQDDPHPDTVISIEPGFRFRRANETAGRLSCDEYGSTYVAPEWVRSRAADCGLRVREASPNALWGQDAWLLERNPESACGRPTPSASPERLNSPAAESS